MADERPASGGGDDGSTPLPLHHLAPPTQPDGADDLAPAEAEPPGIQTTSLDLSNDQPLTDGATVQPYIVIYEPFEGEPAGLEAIPEDLIDYSAVEGDPAVLPAISEDSIDYAAVDIVLEATTPTPTDGIDYLTPEPAETEPAVHSAENLARTRGGRGPAGARVTSVVIDDPAVIFIDELPTLSYALATDDLTSDPECEPTPRPRTTSKIPHDPSPDLPDVNHVTKTEEELNEVNSHHKPVPPVTSDKHPNNRTLNNRGLGQDEGKDEVKVVISEFDAIFKYIGGFGWYQSMLFAVTCYLCMMCACVYFGQLFMTLTPPHWCSAPPYLLQYNLTEEQIKTLTIPRDSDKGDFQSCVRYDVNFTQALENDSWTYPTLPDPSKPNPSWPTIPCTDGWTYNYSLYYPTITSQLDWVCSDDWKPALAQALFFVGSTVGTPTVGWAADRWGRLPLIVATNVLGGVAGVASAFTGSFATFAIMRFFVGLTFEQLLMVGYLLTQEYVSSEYRTVMANVPVMVFLTGSMCALPWLAWWLADWSTLALTIHAPQFIAFIFLCTVPESARWLLSRGRVDQTVSIITRAARVNRRPLPTPVIAAFREFGERQKEKTEQPASVLDLFKTPVLRRRYLALIVMWATLFVAYDGHTRNTENIGHNVFLSFTIAGLVELPADFATMLATEYLGRRHTTVWSLVLSGLAGLSITLIPEDDTTAIMVMAFVGRFLITMSMDIGHQYPVEVLPTVARAQGMGAMQTIGFMCGFASPYIAYMSKYGPWVPYVVLGVLTIGGGLVCLLLPETLNQNLPDTLQDGETFFTGQPLCYNPCAKRGKQTKSHRRDPRKSHSKDHRKDHRRDHSKDHRRDHSKVYSRDRDHNKDYRIVEYSKDPHRDHRRDYYKDPRRDASKVRDPTRPASRKKNDPGA